MLLLVAAAWCDAEPLLALAGQEPEIALMAARYLRLLLPGLGCFTVTQCLQPPASARGLKVGVSGCFPVISIRFPSDFQLETNGKSIKHQ